MSRGLKRVSAVVWLVVAVVSTFKVWVRWQVSPDAHTHILWAITLLGPLAMHFLTIWVIRGFEKSDGG